MTDVALAAVIVIAILASRFTELFFQKAWPLIELAVRQRMQADAAAVDAPSDLEAMRRRIEALERNTAVND